MVTPEEPHPSHALRDAVLSTLLDFMEATYPGTTVAEALQNSDRGACVKGLIDLVTTKMTYDMLAHAEKDEKHPLRILDHYSWEDDHHAARLYRAGLLEYQFQVEMNDREIIA
jgi:hypothetical protein